MQFTLTPPERAEIAKPIKGSGGYQTLFSKLQPLLNMQSGTIALTDELLGEIVRLCSYGSGGYQGRLRKAFKREINSLMNW